MPVPIRVELKSIRTASSRSRETNAYTARLHVDGRFVAVIENEGNGGADRVVGAGAKGNMRHAMEAYDAASVRVASDLPPLPTDDGDPLPMTMELLCATIVERHMILAHIRREAKRKILFFPKGLPAKGTREPLRAHRLESPESLDFSKASILTKLPEAYFLNGLDDDAVVEAYARIS